MHDPSPRVWNNIQASLQKEGLGRSSARLAAVSPKKKEWPTLGWAAALAASLLVGIALLQYSKQDSGTKQLAEADAPGALRGATAQVQPEDGTADNDDDKQLLSEIEQRSPSLKPIYEHNLKNVNSYISEAKSSVQQDPNDSEAREHLRQAYAQKATLYQMATARSLQ
jgi:isopentenyldiphosphate isomerase